MKKIISLILSLAIMITISSANVFAEEVGWNTRTSISRFQDLLKIDKEAAIDYKYEEMEGLSGGSGVIFKDEEIKNFSSEKNYILQFTIDYERWYKLWKWWGGTPTKTNYQYQFKLYTSDCRMYIYRADLTKKNTLTTKEIISESGIPDGSKIFWVDMYYFECPFIKDYTMTECTKGWNTINNTDYYVKSNGTLATKSTIIGGVRYKFTSDGVCHGKYTGWTKSSAGRKYWKDGKMLTKSAIIGGVRYKIKSNGICEGKYTGWTTSGKGKRYWKNGLLVTEKCIRTTSGKKYYADENGYVTVVNN